MFQQLDGAATVRSSAESVIQSLVTQASLDDLLTTGRMALETKAREALQARLNGYNTGVIVREFKLEDVHPSLEVVDAFREFSGAFEEKNRLINEAEGYRNEQLALARGNAEALLKNAGAYQTGRINRAGGEAGRFSATEAAYRGAPQATARRLYLEALETVLPGKKKIILDKGQGRRHLWLLEDGVELPQNVRPPVE